MRRERNLLKVLTDEECLSASKETFANSSILKQSAEALAESGHYGIAISHLVLSTEELVKGSATLYSTSQN
jgi:hypothetical protein